MEDYQYKSFKIATDIMRWFRKLIWFAPFLAIAWILFTSYMFSVIYDATNFFVIGVLVAFLLYTWAVGVCD